VPKKLCPASVIGEILLVPGLKRGRCRARETDPVRPVADKAVKATLPYLARSLAAVVALQQLTGARSGELLIMRLCDTLRKGSVWTYTPTRYKTQYRGHSREIYLGPKAQKILRPFMSIQSDEFFFSPYRDREERYTQLREARKSSVQPSQISRRKRNPKLLPGGHYTPASYRRAIARACKEAKVPVWHPHQIRHAVGTNIRQKHGIEMAQLVLGHTSLTATEIYAEADRTKALRLMRSVG
jgi:integrase